MSGAAKINSKIPSIAMEKYEEPTTMSVNLKKHKSMDSADVGKKIHFHGHGTIKSIRKDQYGHSMSIDIAKLHSGKNSPPDDQEHDS